MMGNTGSVLYHSGIMTPFNIAMFISKTVLGTIRLQDFREGF